MTKSIRSKHRRHQQIQVLILFSTPLEAQRNLQTIGNKNKNQQRQHIKGIYGKWLDIDCVLCRPGSTTYLLGWASPDRIPCNSAAHYCTHMLPGIPTGNAEMGTGWGAWVGGCAWWWGEVEIEMVCGMGGGLDSMEWMVGGDVEIKMELVGRRHIAWMPSPPFPTPIPNFIY